jgi:formylglycine-generating enzyme required for sulfatase activity
MRLRLAPLALLVSLAALSGCQTIPKPATPPAAAGAQIETPGTEFTDCKGCPEMVVLPTGEFMMGATKEESGGVFPERPKHRVAIARQFAIGKYEVTFAELDACVADKGCQRRPFDQGWGRGSRPAVNVSYQDARQYARWLSAKTKQAYRLPSEAEWEYAARAGSKTERFWGNDAERACAYANVGDHTGTSSRVVPSEPSMHRCTDGYRTTAPVGSFKPNGFGLHDMIGNVWEWVADCWNQNYAGAPADGSAWMAGNCKLRIGRGGAYNSYRGYARAAARVPGPPNKFDRRLGFRIAKSLQTKAK